MFASELRQKFLDFFARRGHQIVPSSSLIPIDPSVLLTSAGMQQFKKYYTAPTLARNELGAVNVVSYQKCFRTTDIDEVGDESHLTFFEMLGNFSFGGYGKREAIIYAYDFITKELNLPIVYVTVFGGNSTVPKDEESAAVWRELGIKDIREQGLDDVFWGPTGQAGPCGPTTEIYCANSEGKDVEIWNLVFNQFFYPGSREELLAGAFGKKLEPLSTLGVDTGMGLERLALIVQKKNNIFETDLFTKLLSLLPPGLPEKSQRIVVDHERAAVFLIADGVLPSNKSAGYVLRRLIRRATLYGAEGSEIARKIIELYGDFYPDIRKKWAEIIKVLLSERKQFAETLKQGTKELNKLASIDAAKAFRLYETYGLPFEVMQEKFPVLSKKEFEKEFVRHQEISRAGLTGQFIGGLVDHAPPTVRLHTAHHLLLAALQQVLGREIKQRGSNINQERLRLDFSSPRKLTDDEKKKVEKLVNDKIKENLRVLKKEMAKSEAEKLGAEMEFGAKYGETVSVYSIENERDEIFSIEFCGGPHVGRTSELGTAVAGRGPFRIIKDEALAAGIRRIKAVLE